jgi:hypothetical protein
MEMAFTRGSDPAIPDSPHTLTEHREDHKTHQENRESGELRELETMELSSFSKMTTSCFVCTTDQ